jgi:hypothetical protein
VRRGGRAVERARRGGVRWRRGAANRGGGTGWAAARARTRRRHPRAVRPRVALRPTTACSAHVVRRGLSRVLRSRCCGEAARHGAVVWLSLGKGILFLAKKSRGFHPASAGHGHSLAEAVHGGLKPVRFLYSFWPKRVYLWRPLGIDALPSHSVWSGGRKRRLRRATTGALRLQTGDGWVVGCHRREPDAPLSPPCMEREAHDGRPVGHWERGGSVAARGVCVVWLPSAQRYMYTLFGPKEYM